MGSYHNTLPPLGEGREEGEGDREGVMCRVHKNLLWGGENYTGHLPKARKYFFFFSLRFFYILYTNANGVKCWCKKGRKKGGKKK